MRVCKCCGRLLPDKEFKSGKNICTYCRREQDIKRRYGITHEDYIKMWNEQGGKCKLCGKETDKYLDIDHDHKTGRVRGLLCRGCNLMLDEMLERNVTEGELKRYLNDDK